MRREREREFASKPRHRGGSKVCALHHNGHPVTNTDEAACVLLSSRGLCLVGKQVALTWKSMDVISPLLFDRAAICGIVRAINKTTRLKGEQQYVELVSVVLLRAAHESNSMNIWVYCSLSPLQSWGFNDERPPKTGASVFQTQFLNIFRGTYCKLAV